MKYEYEIKSPLQNLFIGSTFEEDKKIFKTIDALYDPEL